MNAKRNKKSRTRRVLFAALAAGALLLAGCKTQQMKTTPFYEGHDVTYTGAPEEIGRASCRERVSVVV